MMRFASDPIGFFAELRRRHGDVFSVSFPEFGPLVYVTDPALAKQVLTGDPDRFHAGEATATVLEHGLGPNSLLTLDGDEHMRQRKLLLPMFDAESVRGYGDLIAQITEREIETWPIGEPFQMRTHTQAITLEAILRAVIGVRAPDRLERASRLIDEFGESGKAVVLLPFRRQGGGPSNSWSRFEQARAAFDEFIYEEIALRRAETPGDGDDVLSLLLSARHDDGSQMTDEELRDQLATLIEAGHETTAAALAWGFDFLLHTPPALARLRESLAAGGDEYLDAVIKETLRIRPVITDVGRKLTAETEIGGYRIPAGTMVMVGIVALHHRDDLYPQPGEFRPERFLDGRTDNYSWVPFGGGVRRCIGAGFAQHEMRIVLRTILERTELRAASPNPERPRVRSFTLLSPRGPRVILERRT